MAERSAFAMSRAADFLVKRRMERASLAFLPRIRSMTRPAFWAEVRTYLAVDLTSSAIASALLAGRRRRAGARPAARGRGARTAGRAGGARHLGHLLHLGGVALELTGGRELPEFVADHVLRDIDRDELPAVVDGQRVAHHLGRYRRAARPGLHDLALAGLVHRLDLLEEVIVHPRTLLQRTCHLYPRGSHERSRHYFRLLTMNFWVRLLFRVLKPLVGMPQGVTGWRPPEVLPSPPPCGWSTGFIDTPRLWGRRPRHRVRPALPTDTFLWSRLPTWPMVAWHSTPTIRTSPEGSFTWA